jgi:hypothetical protein
MNRTLRLVAFVATAVLLAGCPGKKVRPTDEDTRFAQGRPDIDWVNPVNVYGRRTPASPAATTHSAPKARAWKMCCPTCISITTRRVCGPASARSSSKPPITCATIRMPASSSKATATGAARANTTSRWDARRQGPVKQYLMDLGIDQARIENPLARRPQRPPRNAAAEATMSQDRRADLIVVR